MLLSGRDIMAEVSLGRLGIDPYLAAQVQPASYDVRLGSRFLVFENHLCPVVDPAADNTGLTREIESAGEFILHPGEFILAATHEYVTLPLDLAARLEGKSSLGRLGLVTHSTAGWVDPGFAGEVTMELSNVSSLPIRLRPGMHIGQLCLFRTSSECEPYRGKYQGQQGPVPSRSHLDFGHAQS